MFGSHDMGAVSRHMGSFIRRFSIYVGLGADSAYGSSTDSENVRVPVWYRVSALLLLPFGLWALWVGQIELLGAASLTLLLLAYIRVRRVVPYGAPDHVSQETEPEEHADSTD